MSVGKCPGANVALQDGWFSESSPRKTGRGTKTSNKHSTSRVLEVSSFCDSAAEAGNASLCERQEGSCKAGESSSQVDVAIMKPLGRKQADRLRARAFRDMLTPRPLILIASATPGAGSRH